MPVPILCLDDELRHCAERFGALLSKPHYQYFVTVLLGLLLCEGRRTLSGLVRQVGEHPSLAELNRFLSEAAWSQEELTASWLKHFREEMQPMVEAEQQRQLSLAPKQSVDGVPSRPW